MLFFCGNSPTRAATTYTLATNEDVFVNPELRPAWEIVRKRTLPPHTTLRNMLTFREAPSAPIEVLPAGVVHRIIAGARGTPSVEIYVIHADAGSHRPAILHVHGGGFILGRANDNLVSLVQEARLLDCTIVTVDYRRPPEAPFPAALDDAYAALVWLHDRATEIGVDSTRIAVQGESAGGGLAAMLAIAARDRGVVKLVHQSLVYPMLDDRTGTTRPTSHHVGTILWTPRLNGIGWSAFLGQPAGQATAPPGAVPARVTNVAGLAPAFIGVGSIDLFVGEDMTYAHRMIDAGVPVELVVVPGAYHGFDVVGPPTTLSRQFRLAQLNALARAFNRPLLASLD